ncbi:21S rRNA (GM2251-2'-O)-methyltransferase [Geosmithia morbida]|uniref:rRNA methyltransferase 1, mitochondrial n=1 Tax=Geosmithia morbida TaxID=1094350 RepID=A0A9P4Z1L1_9HYPO|nr:21S rRNA (GM2251-2'-O)-methyltransferase [Geosmithia morbida]KAF4125737.1 21S rRNA (GM2251-2'-O)-methyltransferase [Geosmithia morbida]
MIRSLPFRTVGLSRNAPGRVIAPRLLDSIAAPGLTRSSSLSAIHRGLRRSDRAQHGSGSRGGGDGGGASPPPPSRGRTGSRDGRHRTERALEGAGSKRQQDRLLRKLRRKQEEDEEGTGKMTRRKRFADPTTDFGKRSLVYHLKHGDLKDLAGKIDDPVSPRSPLDNRRKDWAIRDAIAGRTPLPTKEQQQRRRAGGRRDDSGTAAPRDRATFSRRDDGKATRPARASAADDDDDNVSRPAPRPRNGGMMPLTIKYTTAASQFLYGRSVVKAALEQARRKLYRLYIYAGESRIETRDIASLTTLARKHGVPVTMVPNEDQRLMDKMSTGRPHNGFVLEASPLPQLPVTSLGAVEEAPGRPLGFHVELGHQSREEADVNGTEAFIPRRPSTSRSGRPLVLLLNEIVDPGNLGAMLRTASYFGVDAVGVTDRNSSTLTPVVLKSAAGAVEEVSIFTVDSAVRFLEESRRAGWRSFAAVAPPSRKLTSMHAGKFVSTGDIEKENPLAESPCILVLGNEGFGLPKQVKMAADHELSVPRFVHDSCVDSLNVSVAAGLLCNAFVKEPPAIRGPQLARRQEKAEETEEKGQDAMF